MRNERSQCMRNEVTGTAALFAWTLSRKARCGGKAALCTHRLLPATSSLKTNLPTITITTEGLAPHPEMSPHTCNSPCASRTILVSTAMRLVVPDDVRVRRRHDMVDRSFIVKPRAVVALLRGSSHGSHTQQLTIALRHY